MRLLLDEHFSPEIARQLRAQRRDVVAAREDPELHALSDRALLEVARREHRALVTENVVDFIELHRESMLTGEEHAGLIFTSSKRFPRNRRAIGRLVRALGALQTNRSALDGEIVWLAIDGR